MKRTTLVITLWAMFVAAASAQKAGSEQQLAKEANELFASENFLKAYPLYSQLVSLYPQNAEYSYRFGACAIYSDPDKTKAIQFLSSASKREVKDPLVWYYLGKAYHLNYQFKDAVKAYETFVTHADPKLTAKMNAQREIETCIYGSNLLSNIKDVVVINKTETDKSDFFRYMNLDGIGGKILTLPEELQSKLDQKSTTKGVIHYPGNSTTIYFSSYGADGSTGKDIYKANILPDGKFSKAEKVKGGVNTKYDEDYCFLHSNGKTLYFASKGHNSMGGYDIFRSEMDKAGNFGPAINLDFAINTPDDDIFYIADSLNQRAYFASGRTSDQNHLHVYNVMVQGIPLQVVYLKGDFVSDIDAEQKNATIQVRDEMSGRVIMENATNPNSGVYTLYVPKSGDYKYYVKTENSPVIHEARVSIPAFDKPVALRQQIRLVKENGQEKLIVNNYFDEILNEDISALAAEMLRKKAGLEVSDSATQDVVAQATGAQENLSVEKTMTNAALSAGFGDGQTIDVIAANMEKEYATIVSFVQESDTKYNNTYAYALDKQRKAEELTTKAEQLRASTSGYTSDEDVVKLRESLKLLREARELRTEAAGAILAAENVKAFKDKEAARAAALKQNIDDVRKAEAEQNFDLALTELQAEKSRIVELRAGTGDPLGDLKSKSSVKEQALHSAEDKLLNLRNEEKELIKAVTAAQEKLAAAKKNSEKAAAETEYANAKSDLESIQRGIVRQNEIANALGEEARRAAEAVVIFEKLLADSNLGMTAEQIVKLDANQMSSITMKVDALDARFEKLAINDEQTLALIGESEIDESRTDRLDIAISSTLTEEKKPENATSNESNNNSRENVATTANSSDVNNTSIDNTTGNNSSSDNSVAAENTNRSNNEAAPVVVKSAQTLRTDTDATLAKVNTNTPEALAAKRMILGSTLQNTEDRIEEIQKKRRTGITVEERQELENLIALRNEMNEKIGTTAAPTLTSDKVKVVATSVNPDYISKLQDIENAEGTELDRTLEKINLQKQTIEDLKKARQQNAEVAMSSTNSTDLTTAGLKDKEFEAAIISLEKEINDVNTYKAAFDLENKEILESAGTREKLENQIALTQSYMNTLEALEAEKQEELALSTDLTQGEKIRTQIGEIKKEYQIAETKLSSYESDLRLTASASEPAPTQVSPIDSVAVNAAAQINNTTSNNQNLEDVIEAENVSSNDISENQPANVTPSSEEDPAIKVSKDAAVLKEILKPKVESESIFAYETGIIEYLGVEHPELGSKLKEQEKIKALQNEILLIEGEIENETNASKQKKLDRQAEDLYFKRARLEIINAPAIGEMAKAEFEKLTAEVDQLNTENQEDLNSRTMLRDEVQKNYSNAKSLYEEAQALREKAGPVVDDLEKADYYRQAFAKEQLAFELMKQIKDIHGNMDMLLTYDDQELTELRYGNPANVKRGVTKEATANTDVASSNTSITSETPSASSTTTTSEGDVAVVKTSVRASETNPEAVKSAGSSNTSVASEAPVTTTNTTAPTRPIVPATPTSPVDPGFYGDDEANSYFFNAPDVLTKNLFVRTSRAVYSEERPIPMNPEMPKGVYYCVQIGAFRNAIPQNLFDEFAPLIGEKNAAGITRYTAGFFLNFENADQVKLEIRRMGYSDAFVVAYRDGKRIPMYEAIAITDGDVALASLEKEYIYGDGGAAPVAKTPAATSAPASSETSREDRNTNYYKGTPNAVPAIQVETVSGLFYTVQVGVYSKPVPSASLKNISPVNSELTSTKKIRYTSGIYNNLQAAVDQRNQAKELGINDAFITAYYNGKRITLSEADRLLKENGNTILVK